MAGVLIACSGGKEAPKSDAASDTGAADATSDVPHPACHPIQRRPDGSCCPTGQAFFVNSANCEAVGPVGCSHSVFADPRKCRPRWCWDLRTPAGAPCAVEGNGCEVVPRDCTEAEIANGKGCEAGTWPKPDGGCRMAGTWGELQTDLALPGTDADAPPPDLPPLPANLEPEGIPPAVALPPVASTTFAHVDGLPAVPSAAPCLAGAKDCSAVGVPWTCPPGFEVDASQPAPTWGLPPCRAAADDCGPGPYKVPDKPPPLSPPALYVDASASAVGADGTFDHPFPSLPQAVAAAIPGLTLWLAAGTYAPVTVDKQLTLIGRCAHLTRIDAGAAGHAVDVLGGQDGPITVTVKGVQLLGQNRGLRVGQNAAVALSRSWLHRLRGLAIQTRDGGHLEASDVVVSGTLSPETGGNAAFAIGKASSAVLQRVRVRVAATAGDGVRVEMNSKLQADHLLVDGTQPSADGESRGLGLMVQAMSSATIDRLRVADTQAEGVAAYGLGVEVTLTGALVTGAGGPKLGKVEWAAGIEAKATAKLEVRAAVVASSTGLGVHCKDPGTQLRATGLVVRDTRPVGTGEMGSGAYVHDGCTAKGRFWWLAGNRAAGMAMENAGTSATLADLTVRDTQATQAGDYGMGVLVATGAQATIERARVHNNLFGGVIVDGGGVLTLRRALVSSTHVEQASGLAGHGIDVYGTKAPSQALVEDTVVRLNQNIGVFVDDPGSELTLRRCIVLNTGAGMLGKNENRGIGILARHSSKLVLEDVRSHNNRRFGVVVAGKASLEARRLVIDRTQPDAVLGHDGRGLLVTTGGQAVVRSARVHANHAAGAECNSAGSSLTLHDGLIDATDLQYLDGNAGMSIFVHKDCALSVTGARLHASHFAGVGSAQTQVPFRLRGVLIDDTLLVESPQLTSNGSLLLLDSAGTSEVRSSRLVRSIGTSVFSFASLLDMSDTVIGEVAQHLFPGLPDASGFSRTYNELSDGVAGSQSLRYHGSRLLLYGHARAGMLLSGVPDALVERTVIRGGDFGLAWQDGTKLVDSFNAIVDAKQPRASDQGLAAAVPPPLVALHGKQ